MNRSNLFEMLENRQMMAADLRSFDGTGNNLANPTWGSANTPLVRLTGSAYADGIGSPSGASRPSARAISNAVSDHPDEEILNARGLSAYAYLWGQFIDHDLDLTNGATPSEYFNIQVPTGDAYFDPTATGTQQIYLTRSQYAAGTGVTSPRQQVNSITSFIDGSMVYGSDSTRAMALRTLVGGKMKTSAGNLLPWNTMGLDNATLGGPASGYFAAGDVRANENIELSSIQTLFVREHNRIATQIGANNSNLTDEQIYQQARKIVIGEIQAITYNEFLPALLGQGAIAPYSGYKPNVNAAVSNEFSTAAFRLGHSMLADDVEFLDNQGNDVRDPLSLSQAFFNPTVLTQTGIDPLLKYLASSNSEEIDTKVVGSLRNFLFGQPGAGGFDLASLNIQRGRDHGLKDYNSVRAALGLGKVTSFAQITNDTEVQTELKNLYGSVDNIDLWVGGLAENHLPGSSLGPTFQRIVADQFTRTRDGDRFWYQIDLSPADAQMVSRTTLADVVRRNSAVTNLQPNVFVFNVDLIGRVYDDRNGNGRADPGEPGLANRKVDLLDDSNTLINTLQTRPDGSFDFSQVQIGHYHLRAQIPTGWHATNPAPLVDVTRGGAIAGLNIGQTRNSPPPPPSAGAPVRIASATGSTSTTPRKLVNDIGLA